MKSLKKTWWLIRGTSYTSVPNPDRDKLEWKGFEFKRTYGSCRIMLTWRFYLCLYVACVIFSFVSY